MKEDLVVIGKITKPHGVRGELKLVPFFELEDLLAHLDQVWLVKADQKESYSVEWVRGGGRFHIMKLQDVDDLAAAGHLRDLEVAVSKGKLPPLSAGRYYSFQLVGLTVVTESGDMVGEIHEVWPTPAHDLYRVRGKKGELLIPAVKEIVTDIDLEQGRVVIRALDGLME
jgi:16S rRNA processing protein RimM